MAYPLCRTSWEPAIERCVCRRGWQNRSMRYHAVTRHRRTCCTTHMPVTVGCVTMSTFALPPTPTVLVSLQRTCPGLLSTQLLARSFLGLCQPLLGWLLSLLHSMWLSPRRPGHSKARPSPSSTHSLAFCRQRKMFPRCTRQHIFSTLLPPDPPRLTLGLLCTSPLC